MSMSIYAGAYGSAPKPELEGILTDLPFRIIFIHGLNSTCTSVGGRYDDSETVGLKPIKSPFELPLAIEAYSFYHEGNLLEDVDSIARAAASLRTALSTGFSHGFPSNQSDRRTILICHGSGGFIVKEALLRSVNQSDPEQAFHQLILGLIFIGTPHSTVDERIPYQLNLMRNNQGPKSSAISMKIIASVTTLLRGFNSLDWSRFDFKPVSLFEEVGLPDAPEDFGPVVNCEDVFIRSQKQIGLHANHWSTWNFSDPFSPTYKAISTIIQSFCHDLPSNKFEGYYQQMDPDISGLLRSLHVTSTESFSTPMQGTCSWIFQHEAFGSWLEQPSGLLWIKGKPGSGKSTLLRFIHQTVTFSEPTSLFFFQFNNSGHSSTNAMLRSLIFQLLARRPCYQLQGMRDTYAIRTKVHGDYGADWQWGDPELLSYLRESLLQATQEDSHLVIFLDALDEATEDMPIDSIILSILTIPSIRICASSRSGPNLSNVETRTIILDDLNAADITYYTKSMVSSVDYKGEYIQRNIIPSLIEASDGRFLYVHLVLSNLEIWIDQLEGQGEGQAGHIDFPKGLDDLYCLIVSRIESSLENREIVRLIFQWVAFATRPLIVTELTDAMALGSLDGTSMINLLISHGADALTADGSGWNPLHYAIAAGKRATLAQLLSTIPKTSFERLKDLPPRNLPGWVHRILLAFGLGLCCRGSGCSSSSATNSGSKSSGKARKCGRQSSKKRGRDSTENMDENDEQSMAPPPQKQSRHAFGLRFACPYNKRCPNRFGGACSNFGFPDMHRLKCKLIFPESEIQDHLILEVACEPTRVAVNYEDGFDTNQSDALKSLKPKQFETPVHQWQKTFNTVFPDWTADLPSPYHETSETECRIRVAQTLRSEEFRQEVWRNPSDMGREVFEGLANILDPSPSTATRPDSQSLSMPNELPMRPAITQENEQIALNPSVANILPTDPQRGTAAPEALPGVPVLDTPAQRYRQIPPGTGSINSFGPGQESMYGDGNDASISSWDCSFPNVQMAQSSNDPLEFAFNAPASTNLSHSSRHENQPKHNRGTSTSANTRPEDYEDATHTFWFPSRRDD
ncbi:hypothetical protein FVER53590_10553 [Fusarium verticillioides]|nr:hypothetical protein FVER53590_10553 [Fusarium verticillioides]